LRLGHAAASEAEAEQEISVSFGEEGSVGLELTVTHDQTSTGLIQESVCVLAIRPGTQATAHVPPLCPGLVVTCVGDVAVRGRPLDDVFAAIVEHDHRPLTMRFVTPLQRRAPTPEEEQEEREEKTHTRAVRQFLSSKGMEACTSGVCEALSQHGTPRSEWLATLRAMGPATLRDLLEAVRAQYERESPLRNLCEWMMTAMRCDDDASQPPTNFFLSVPASCMRLPARCVGR
jgi:hypothetical protein